MRDVKRQSEQRRERKRDEEGQDLALKVSSTDDDVCLFGNSFVKISSETLCLVCFEEL